MADFVLQDDQNVELTLQLTDDAGNIVGALPAGVTVAWATANDPDSALAITPSADTLSCNVKATGKLATGAQVTATATLPPATAPVTAVLAIDVVTSPATGFGIVPGAPAHN